MDIAHGISDVSVSEKFLDVEWVFGAPGFHCSFEVPERFEAYL